MTATETTPMATKAAHPMTPGRPGDVASPASADVAGCPVRGGPVPDRTGRLGHRAAWCSKGCRQRAWRARTAADRAARAAAAHVAEFRRARAVVRRAPASRSRRDDSPADCVATTAVQAPATNHPASSGAPVGEVVVDVDELFDAIEDVLDVRDAPGIPQDVLQDVPDVLADVLEPSFVDTLEALAAAHTAASEDGPLDGLAAAAAVVVRARPPHLPARADAVIARLAAALPSKGK